MGQPVKLTRPNLNIALPTPLKKRLNRIAQKEERDLGSHIRWVLEKYAEDYECGEKSKIESTKDLGHPQ